MGPDTSTTLETPVLNQFFNEYVEAASQRLAGLQVLPLVNVPDRAGTLMVMKREAALKIDLDGSRAPGGTYNRVEWDFAQKTYSTDEFGFEWPIDAAEEAQYSKYMEIRRNTTKLAIDHLLRLQEHRIIAEVFNATTFSGYTADVDSNEWNDPTNAAPKANAETVIAAMLANCGMKPTHVIMPETVFRNVMQCDEIVDVLKYTTPNLYMPWETQRQMLSTYLGVEVIIGGSYYDAALEGSAASLSAMWGTEYALWFVKSDGFGMPGIGWTVNWSDDSPANVNVEEYIENQTRGSVIRVRHHTQSNVFSAEYGYLTSNMTG